MADRHARNSRRGGDRGGFHDESSHHDKHGRDERYGGRNDRDRNRDYDRDRRRDRDRDRGGDRDRDYDRDRTRDREHDRERDRDRRYRSRSRDRKEKDRRRSQSPSRDYGRRDDRSDKDRGYRSRRDDGRDNFRDRNGKEADKTDRHRDYDRDHQDISASASPHPPTSPKHQQQNRFENEPTALPNRSRPSEPKAPVTASTPPAPVSFKVKGREGSHPADHHSRPHSRGQSQEFDDGHSRWHGRGHPAEEDDRSRGRFEDDPMDQDDDEEVVVEDDDFAAMQAMMGFGGFDSTKGKKIKGNNQGAVHKEKKTEYRQYMNRVGGFNRPLSPSR